MVYPTTIIASSLHLKGTLHCKSACVIYGHVEGVIFSDESVLIEKNGSFKGSIYAPMLVVQGLCEGEMTCECVKILHGGHIKGKIKSLLFVMHPKALFEGFRECITPYNEKTSPAHKTAEFDTENILL
jgi:cytoskeletal protein CcmA (bactofilin family)